jgi:hypothetical protein
MERTVFFCKACSSVRDLSHNADMSHANRLWVPGTDMGDFAPEADDQRVDVQQARLLGRWHSPGAACSTALELALGSMAGVPVPDGLFPWAARHARQLGLQGTHWGLLHLCHWQVSNGQVFLRVPDGPAPEALSPLWHELADFVAEAGLTLIPGSGLAALVHGEPLRDLPTAAWAKVQDRPVGPYLPASPALRRLQSELQMWFYTHPLLQGMARPINSVWLSGTGALNPELSTWLDRIQWQKPDSQPARGDHWLCANDVQASLWEWGTAPWLLRLWRRHKPVPRWEPDHELD